MQDASDFEMMLGSLRVRGLEGREIQWPYSGEEGIRRIMIPPIIIELFAET
jgi:hypothetical protein